MKTKNLLSLAEKFESKLAQESFDEKFLKEDSNKENWIPDYSNEDLSSIKDENLVELQDLLFKIKPDMKAIQEMAMKMKVNGENHPNSTFYDVFVALVKISKAYHDVMMTVSETLKK